MKTQAHRHTGTQAHRHTGTQAHRHTGTQAHRHTGTQAHRHTGTQFNFYLLRVFHNVAISPRQTRLLRGRQIKLFS